ncbi:F-box protein At5g07610-like [Bidens hawaiensis]|uniref:F-box protein At5g07610-like n=1 Tax=Bidens hawaiensis TaxID=980011 RepID=UPI0040498F0D
MDLIAKIKETLNFIQTYFSQASIEASDYQPTQSGALVGSSDDLLTEILLRLPVTSIFRFKSVCKHWLWLLGDKHFTLLYDSLSKTPGFFIPAFYIPSKFIPFDVKNPSPPPFCSLNLYFDLRDIKIMQSCNGLLLCCSQQGDMGNCKYYVFNPTTKQSGIIPSLPEGDNICRTICFMGLAFHQTDCVHYKIVCVCCLKSYPNPKHQIQIYSSDTGKWRISVESFYVYFSSSRYGVYWNGAIHWDHDPCDKNHLYFEIEAEQLQTFPLPVEMTSPGAFTMYFGESRGHLHLIVNNDRTDNRLHFNVNEMLSDHSGWFVKYQVQLDELPHAFPKMKNPFGYDFSVLDVVKGEEEDTFMVVITPGKMVKYNLYHKAFEQIFSFPCVFHYEWHDVHRYITNLSSF